MLAVDTEQDSVATHRRKRLQRQIAEAEKQLQNLIDSIQGGVKAEYVVPRLDALADEIAEAEVELSRTVVERVVTDATELRDVVLALGGGIDELLAHGTLQERAAFYAGLGVELVVDPEQHTVSVTLTPTADRAAAVHERRPCTR